MKVNYFESVDWDSFHYLCESAVMRNQSSDSRAIDGMLEVAEIASTNGLSFIRVGVTL